MLHRCATCLYNLGAAISYPIPSNRDRTRLIGLALSTIGALREGARHRKRGNDEEGVRGEMRNREAHMHGYVCLYMHMYASRPHSPFLLPLGICVGSGSRIQGYILVGWHNNISDSERGEIMAGLFPYLGMVQDSGFRKFRGDIVAAFWILVTGVTPLLFLIRCSFWRGRGNGIDWRTAAT